MNSTINNASPNPQPKLNARTSGPSHAKGNKAMAAKGGAHPRAESGRPEQSSAAGPPKSGEASNKSANEDAKHADAFGSPQSAAPSTGWRGSKRGSQSQAPAEDPDFRRGPSSSSRKGESRRARPGVNARSAKSKPDHVAASVKRMEAEIAGAKDAARELKEEADQAKEENLQKLVEQLKPLLTAEQPDVPPASPKKRRSSKDAHYVQVGKPGGADWADYVRSNPILAGKRIWRPVTEWSAYLVPKILLFACLYVLLQWWINWLCVSSIMKWSTDMAVFLRSWLDQLNEIYDPTPSKYSFWQVMPNGELNWNLYESTTGQSLRMMARSFFIDNPLTQSLIAFITGPSLIAQLLPSGVFRALDGIGTVLWETTTWSVWIMTLPMRMMWSVWDLIMILCTPSKTWWELLMAILQKTVEHWSGVVSALIALIEAYSSWMQWLAEFQQWYYTKTHWSMIFLLQSPLWIVVAIGSLQRLPNWYSAKFTVLNAYWANMQFDNRPLSSRGYDLKQSSLIVDMEMECRYLFFSWVGKEHRTVNITVSAEMLLELTSPKVDLPEAEENLVFSRMCDMSKTWGMYNIPGNQYQYDLQGDTRTVAWEIIQYRRDRRARKTFLVGTQHLGKGASQGFSSRQ